MLWQFCLSRWDALWQTVQIREVQINKFGRNAFYAPMFLEAMRRLRTPAAFVEVGASAGLGMLWPQLICDYGQGRRIRGHRSEGRFELNCEVKGEPRFPLSGNAPNPALLLGIDPHPLSSKLDSDARWLHALTAPGDAVGRKLLEDGLRLAREVRPEVIKGCALKRLPEVVASLSEQQPIVVYHAMTLHHFTEARKLTAWQRLLYSLGAKRPLIEIGIEWKHGKRVISPWPVELTITEWHKRRPSMEILGWPTLLLMERLSYLHRRRSPL